MREAVKTRHLLHRYPELSHHEEETAALVAQRLQALGLEDVRTGVGGHGVVATLRGTGPGKLRRLALRADMDALPIQEESDLPYRSERPGVMHACGHDGHTATLLAAATVLRQVQHCFPGEVRFIFQPAEETVGGASEMCADGVMEGVDAILALHGWPGIGAGKIGIRSGSMMASADTFDVTILGAGSHAAMPHAGVDPILVGAHVVSALQSIASREISPVDPVVVTVTQFHAGTAYNVIPASAELKGTVRCLSPEIRASMPERLERIAAGVCGVFRSSCRFSYREGTPVTVNSPEVVEMLADTASEQFGADAVVRLDAPSMGAEDFAYYLQHAPGAMFRLGVGENSPNLHTPYYNFADEALPYGIQMFVAATLRFLGQTPQ